MRERRYILFRSVSARLEAVEGRKTKYAQITGEVRLEVGWRPLLSIPPPPSGRPSFPGQTEAVVCVFLYSANNLGRYTPRGATVPLQPGYLPSPQATVTLTSAGLRNTKILEETQQANFNEGFLFLLGTDWASQTIKIQVDDRKKRKSFSVTNKFYILHFSCPPWLLYRCLKFWSTNLEDD